METRLNTTLGRRTLLATTLLGAFAARVGAHAQAVADAAAPIKEFDDALLSIMRAGKAAPFPQRYGTLAPVVSSVFDLEAILSAAVGVRWSKLQAADQASLLNVFSRFTIASYVAAFDSYNGQRFDISPEQRSVGSEVVIETQIVRTSGAPARIDYVMRASDTQRGAGWRAVDVLLDGSISRVAVLRSDFRKLLTQDSATPLIASLKQKVADLSGGSLTG
jgi:phospholipid transport system substrate-binding protein